MTVEITQGAKSTSQDLPKQFRRTDSFEEKKKGKSIKCYSLKKDRILKFIKLKPETIGFYNNYYMNFKDMVETRFLGQIWCDEYEPGKELGEEEEEEEEEDRFDFFFG